MRAHRSDDRHRARQRILSVLTLTLGMLAAVLLPASASADVDDFSYSSWESRYEVSLDDEGRAVAHVTETLVAEFPDAPQNKGIVRGYPERYQGAGLSLDIVSVTDADGNEVPFETESDDGTLYVLTGTDDYVMGSTTYVIEYTMRDLMITGTDSGNDEFYWNLLPLSSTQPIERFRAEILFSDELASALTGDAACYDGQYGSESRCELTGPREVDGGALFTLGSGPRAAGDGVTVAVGFTAGAVTQPPSRLPDPVSDYGPAVLGLGALGAATGAVVSTALFVRRRRKATGIVVAQFDVPADMPPLVAAALIPSAAAAVPAQMVHLAVQGAVRLEEQPGEKQPSVRLIDRSAVTDPLDRAMLQALLGGERTVRQIPKKSTKFAKRMEKLVAKGVSTARSRGWTAKERSRTAVALAWASLALTALGGGLVVWALMRDRDVVDVTAFLFLASAVSALIAAVYGLSRHTVLTSTGAERYEYLLGVKEFVRVAEADRLRMLQSYQGAERRPDGSVDVIHLYEKLLPYAMLFRQEKSWGKVLDTAYSTSGQGPTWMDVAVGTSIASSLSHYSAPMQAAASYTPSSSSGGSTGGGFSGGGGGGGFSGGR